LLGSGFSRSVTVEVCTADVCTVDVCTVEACTAVVFEEASAVPAPSVWMEESFDVGTLCPCGSKHTRLANAEISGSATSPVGAATAWDAVPPFGRLAIAGGASETAGCSTCCGAAGTGSAGCIPERTLLKTRS